MKRRNILWHLLLSPYFVPRFLIATNMVGQGIFFTMLVCAPGLLLLSLCQEPPKEVTGIAVFSIGLGAYVTFLFAEYVDPFMLALREKLIRKSEPPVVKQFEGLPKNEFIS